MRSTIFGTCLVSSTAWASNYCFVDKDHPFHIDATYSKVAGADVTTHPVKHTHLHYSEGDASVYFSHYLNPENALSWQLGFNYVGLGWDKNPRFHENNYYYGIASLAWISHSIDRWRWILNGGVAVDTRTFNFGRSGVYYAMLWGRYQQSETIGVHLGFFGYYGARNGYLLPILGMDWKWSPSWHFKAVFPMDVSLDYHFVKHWTTSLLFSSFGGPYRFPRRVHDGEGRYENGIFEVYATTVEWDLKFYQKNIFQIGIGAGWTFGGWILIKDSHNHHGKYYNFDPAPYGRVFAAASF
jgi:hypothetical protein